MAKKRIQRSITLYEDTIKLIDELCEHKKDFSRKAEEMILIGLAAYKQGVRLETKIVGLNNDDSTTEEKPPKSQFNSKFLA